jgi:hypothetical protein
MSKEAELAMKIADRINRIFSEVNFEPRDVIVTLTMLIGMQIHSSYDPEDWPEALDQIKKDLEAFVNEVGFLTVLKGGKDD